MPAVVTLASCQVDSSSERRVKTAAEAGAVKLREIKALSDPHEHLLRPSEAAISSTDTLLRPIMGDSGSPQTLVRPLAWRPDDSPEELLRAEKPEDPKR